MQVLAVLETHCPEGWVAAGFIRNLVWDKLAGLPVKPLEDVDVLIHDPSDLSYAPEEEIEDRLNQAMPDIPWSVRNQARMHLRNHDDAYEDIAHAMSCWLETATGIAVRLVDGRLELMAAYGLQDLFEQKLRPTQPGFQKLDQLKDRADGKGWLRRWPKVSFVVEDPASVWCREDCLMITL